MFKKKSAPKTFLEVVNEKLNSVTEAVRQGSDRALIASEPYLDRANAWVADASEAAAPKLREAGTQIQHAAEEAGARLQVAADNVRPKLDEVRERIEKGYAEADKRAHARAGELSATAGQKTAAVAGLLASAQAPAAVENAIVKATGDKKAVKKARKALKKAGKDVAKRTAPKKKGGAWFFVLIGLLGVAGIAYFVATRLKPAEDPWSTPLENGRPADARPVGSTPRSEQAASLPEVSEVDAPKGSVSEEELAAEAAEKQADAVASADEKPKH